MQKKKETFAHIFICIMQSRALCILSTLAITFQGISGWTPYVYYTILFQARNLVILEARYFFVLSSFRHENVNLAFAHLS